MMGKDRRGEGGMDEGRRERGVRKKKEMTGCFRRINLGLGELSYHYRLKPRFFSLCFTVNTLKSSMGAVRLCLLVMVIQRLLKNISRKFLLETLRISPFKSI